MTQLFQIISFGRSQANVLASSLPAPRSDPTQYAVERESFDDVMAAITRLPGNQATAIVMRFVQSESYETIAAALGCGYVTHRLGLSPIVGYLAAGIVVGRLQHDEKWAGTGDTT